MLSDVLYVTRWRLFTCGYPLHKQGEDCLGGIDEVLMRFNVFDDQIFHSSKVDHRGSICNLSIDYLVLSDFLLNRDIFPAIFFLLKRIKGEDGR